MARDSNDMGQPSTRRPGRWTDQHGRKWHASVDKRSGGAVGPIQPLGWRAPWVPDQTYFRFSEDDHTKMTIDYQSMLDSRLAAHEAWDNEFRSAALKRGWEPSDHEKRNSLIELVGPKPHPVEPILAAMQGNKWILGQTQTVDPRLEGFIPKKVTRTERALNAVDYSFDPDAQPESLKDDLETLMDIEEAVDPEATPKGRVPMKPKGKKPVAA
jgi:hypothetical protein